MSFLETRLGSKMKKQRRQRKGSESKGRKSGKGKNNNGNCRSRQMCFGTVVRVDRHHHKDCWKKNGRGGKNGISKGGAKNV